MTQKILKVVLFLFIILSFCISYVYATDINLNLPGIMSTPVDENNFTQDTDPTQDEQDLNTPEDDETENNEFNEANEAIENDNMYSQANLVDTSTLSPTSISTTQNSGLGITNIINILLITVGVIIILLAIAIMIRLKN